MPHAIVTPEQIALAGRIEAQLSKLIDGRWPSRRAIKRALAVVMPSLDQLDIITDAAAFDALLDGCPLMNSFLEFMCDAALDDGLFVTYADNDRIVWEADDHRL